ncbi:hypothetical protein [Magnetospira thiophila]
MSVHQETSGNSNPAVAYAASTEVPCSRWLETMSAHLFQDNLDMVKASLRFWNGCADDRPEVCGHIGDCPVEVAKQMLADHGPEDSLTPEEIEAVFERALAPYVERPDPLITG